MEKLFLSTATDTWTILLIFSSSLVEHHCALLTYSNASSGKKTWLNCESMITQTFSDFDGPNEEETIKINKLMMNFEFVLLIHIVMWIAGDLDSYVNSWWFGNTNYSEKYIISYFWSVPSAHCHLCYFHRILIFILADLTQTFGTSTP